MRYYDDWEIKFYSSGLFLKTMVFKAYSRADALRQLHESGVKVIEIMYCKNLSFR